MPTRKKRTAKRTAPAARTRSKKSVSRPGGKRAGAMRERRQKAPETLRLRSIEPSLTVDDLERSVRFYSDLLGFFVGDRWTDGGVLRGVMLKAGMCELGLSQDDWAKGRNRKTGEGVRISCQTAQDIDALAARIKAGGGRLTEEPQDTAWGTRSLSVDDPDGFHVTIYRKR
jgi:catechol 2,3-dioxygenase-like lactoylglutathione lyase family enzyme